MVLGEPIDDKGPIGELSSAIPKRRLWVSFRGKKVLTKPYMLVAAGNYRQYCDVSHRAGFSEHRAECVCDRVRRHDSFCVLEFKAIKNLFSGRQFTRQFHNEEAVQGHRGINAALRVHCNLLEN